MTSTSTNFDKDAALQQVAAGAAAGKLSAGAVQNITVWLTESRYAAYAPQVAAHLAEEKWQALDDAFWTIIPFGTGGRRGRMYPIGSNAINDRTIGESAQGLADYVKENVSGELSCAIAYDTRHNSRHFAELCAGIMVAAGFKVYFLGDYRSTPELSFLVRYKRCSCGIMVTASHNPPSDNAVKVYWSTGGQVLPPHDKGIIDRVMNVQEITVANFESSVQAGKVVFCTAEVDAAFQREVLAQRFEGPRDVSVLYSPLHGVGASAVLPVLAADGFKKVELYGPHSEQSGDFPNVPGHVSNPENPEVFAAAIEHARQTGAEIVIATDPDCDRLGCVAPRTMDVRGEWGFLTGNQIGALLTDFILQRRKKAGTLSPEHYVVKTLVTSAMIRRIADSYGVRTIGDLQVGFKYIGGAMDEHGPDKFVFGTEESHGYLVGQYARDKDAAVAAMLLCEMAAAIKAEGKSILEKLDALYWQHGYHAEHLLSVQMEGSEGMANMQMLMARFRSAPPATLAGVQVKTIRDYKNLVTTPVGGQPVPLVGPKGDMVMLDLAEDGNYIAVRPSGTEPKVKFYMFTFVPAEELHNLQTTKNDMATRIRLFEEDLRAYALQV
jgi:phosphoglucomutase/phosphomannomutase